MIDTVYLTYGPGGIQQMYKTVPNRNLTYLKVRVEVPDPPEVKVTVPQVSPEVRVTNHVEPDVIEGLIWCEEHEATHAATDDWGCPSEGWGQVARVGESA